MLSFSKMNVIIQVYKTPTEKVLNIDFVSCNKLEYINWFLINFLLKYPLYITLHQRPRRYDCQWDNFTRKPDEIEVNYRSL